MELDSNVKHNISILLPYLQEQVTIQKKLAKKFGDQEYRKGLHEASADKFLSAVVTLENTISYISSLEIEIEELQKKKPKPGSGIQLSLKFEEVADLPEELLKELSLSDADKTEYQIREIIEELGGIASLDRLIVGMYRKTEEVLKRPTMTSRLYRMMQKGAVFGVPNRKGVYSLEELTEDEAEKLIRGEKDSAN